MLNICFKKDATIERQHMLASGKFCGNLPELKSTSPTGCSHKVSAPVCFIATKVLINTKINNMLGD